MIGDEKSETPDGSKTPAPVRLMIQSLQRCTRDLQVRASIIYIE